MTRPKPSLTIVSDPPADVTMLLRAEIAKRDWGRVHCEGDRRRPIEIGEMRKRGWRL